jgi:hypothetical protein
MLEAVGTPTKRWLNRVEAKAISVAPQMGRLHKPVDHGELIESLVETLGFRNIAIDAERYAASLDGNVMIGVLETDRKVADVQLVVGVRNAHNKLFRLAITPGCRVLECDNLIFFSKEQDGRKHTRNLSVHDFLAVEIDHMYRSLPQIAEEIVTSQATILEPDAVKLFIYRVFVEGAIKKVPRHLDRAVHRQLFNPAYDVCRSRTEWALRNAFANSLLELDPLPQFTAALELGFLF